MNFHKRRTICSCCGAMLWITDENSSVIRCDSCDSQQTMFMVDDEKIMQQSNKANQLRQDAYFDRARSIYEEILTVYPDNAELNWRICLCQYGVTYVDDPKTGKKIPTCHRTERRSIYDNTYFQSAIANAGEEAKRIYQREAAYIDVVQKKILKIVDNEEPYDVFICYKEESFEGERTEESQYAQNIYEKLTEMGYKVFLSRITLMEEKLGEEYEPHIYAALSTARVMLMIAFSKEYLEAPWVRNEWKRYIDMMRRSQQLNKQIIGCYKYIRPETDYPPEIQSVQALNLEKIGWDQDLYQGIRRIIPKNDVSEKRTDMNINAENKEILMQNASECLNQGKFDEAIQYYSEVLELNPRNGDAYLGMALAEHRLSEINCEKSLDFLSDMYYANQRLKSETVYHDLKDNANFALEVFGSNMKHALQFLDEPKKHTVEQSLYALNTSLYASYLAAKQVQAEQLKNQGKYISASRIFEGLGDADNLEKAKECFYLYADHMMKQNSYQEALQYFQKAGDYADSAKRAANAEEMYQKKLTDEKNTKICEEKLTAIKKKYREMQDTADEKFAALTKIKADMHGITEKMHLSWKGLWINLALVAIALICFFAHDAILGGIDFSQIPFLTDFHFTYLGIVFVVSITIGIFAVMLMGFFILDSMGILGRMLIVSIVGAVAEVVLLFLMSLLQKSVVVSLAEGPLSMTAASIKKQFVLYMLFMGILTIFITVIPIIRYRVQNIRWKQMKKAYDNKLQQIEEMAIQELKSIEYNYGAYFSIKKYTNELKQIISKHTLESIMKQKAEERMRKRP